MRLTPLTPSVPARPEQRNRGEAAVRTGQDSSVAGSVFAPLMTTTTRS